MKSLFMMIISLSIVSLGVVLWFLFSGMPEPDIEVLDVSMKEGRMSYSIRVSQGTLDLDACSAQITSGGETAFLRLGIDDGGPLTRRKISYPLRDSSSQISLREPLSKDLRIIGDIDLDGKRDSAAICHEVNCPKDYAGRYLLFNLSGQERPSYVQLKDLSQYDLRKGSQDLDISFSLSLDKRIGIALKGKTGEIPYVIGLNSEALRAYLIEKLPLDMDGDGSTDYLTMDEDRILLIYSTGKNEVRLDGPAESSIGSTSIEITEEHAILIPSAVNTGIFITEPLMATSSSLYPEDSIRIALDLPSNPDRGEDVIFSLDCQDGINEEISFRMT